MKIIGREENQKSENGGDLRLGYLALKVMQSLRLIFHRRKTIKERQMKVKDQKKWDSIKAKNNSGYSNPVIKATENWSRLIEESIKKNGIEKTDFKKLAFEASEEYGLSYVQAGFMRNFLRHQWIHGEKYKDQIEALGF